MGEKGQKHNLIILVGTFCILSVVICFYKTPFNMVSDEHVYKQLAYNFWKSEPPFSFHYPPLYSLCLAWTFIAGKYFWLVMYLFNIFVKAVGISIIYKLLTIITDRRKALLASFLICFSPIYFIYSRLIMAENLFAPLLIISVLFHMIYVYKRQQGFTIVAALLTMGLYATKYLALILVPIFFGYWLYESWNSKTDEEYHSRIKSTIQRAGIYIGTYLCVGGIYTLWYCLNANKVFSISLLKQIMGFSIGSGPENVGYYVFPSLKWLVCYASYGILGVILIVALLIKSNRWRRKNSIYLNILDQKRVAFLTLVCIALVFIAARHSTYIHYNEGGMMKKLLGRYVSYITPLCGVIYGIVKREEEGG